MSNSPQCASGWSLRLKLCQLVVAAVKGVPQWVHASADIVALPQSVWMTFIWDTSLGASMFFSAQSFRRRNQVVTGWKDE
ncbi:hypothetical protein M1D51_05905 [Arthrobacter sp. R3-55]